MKMLVAANVESELGDAMNALMDEYRAREPEDRAALINGIYGLIG
jgi:hypothetical protein